MPSPTPHAPSTVVIGRTYFSGNTFAPSRSRVVGLCSFAELSDRERSRLRAINCRDEEALYVRFRSLGCVGGIGTLPASVWEATRYETAEAMSEAYAAKRCAS